MRRLKKAALLIAVMSALTAAVVLGKLIGGLPSLAALSDPATLPSVRIEDRHGRLLYEAMAAEGGRHRFVPLTSTSAWLQWATVATEDSSFYQNPGVDLRGVLRALWINIRGRETLAGGSTITQQVARNLLLEAGASEQRTLWRKLRESVLAWRLTRSQSKEQILELYLNHMNYGGMAYGVEAASQTYFAKPAAELDLAESALIAGLPQAPALYNPLTDPAAAKERQEIVLGLMHAGGWITAQEQELAANEPMAFAATPYPVEAPHYVFMVQEQLSEILPGDSLFARGGLTVRTSLDLDWQHHAERIVQGQLRALNQPGPLGEGHRVDNAALVCLDPRTGEILALVGSPDYFEAAIDGAINMAVAPRQPGSALKPIVYAAAMDPVRQSPHTAATLILDVHTAFVTHEGLSYTPVNFDLRQHGPVLAREALASSLNIPAVRTIKAVGVESVIALAQKLGITTFGDPETYDLSLALGSGEVRLLELTGAYAAFANGGFRISPHAILEIQDARGEVLYLHQEEERVPVLDARVAWLISDILSDNDARTMGFGANSTLRIDRPAAVKTGTTTNFRDNWTVGYTPSLVVGVWVGNADNRPMLDVTGVSGAAPIWHQFVRRVSVGVEGEGFNRPEGMVRVEICALSGDLPTEDCTFRRYEWFLTGTEPKQRDTFHRSVAVDTRTGCLAGENTPAGYVTQRVALVLPPEVQPWARGENLLLLGDLACSAEGSLEPDAGAGWGLRMVSPDANAVFLIAPTLPLDAQRLRLMAVGEAGFTQVSLWLDGEAIAVLDAPPYHLWWTPTVGLHEVWAQGALSTGEVVTSEILTFEVLPQEP